MRAQATIMTEHATHLRGLVTAAEHNAAAAKASADALINIERAWVEAYLSFGPKPHRLETSRNGTTTTRVSVKYDCKNLGKTPAWIGIKQIGMMILESETAVPTEFPDKIASFALIGPEAIKPGEDMPHIGAAQCEGRITKEHPGFLYGRITYRDIFWVRRVTTFGYWVREDALMERLPFVYPAYNEHT